jgi:predicted ArsR family transcriptional regulator
MPWTEEKINHVLNNYGTMTIDELALDVGKNISAVRALLKQHYLDKKNIAFTRKFTEESAGG